MQYGHNEFPKKTRRPKKATPRPPLKNPFVLKKRDVIPTLKNLAEQYCKTSIEMKRDKEKSLKELYTLSESLFDKAFTYENQVGVVLHALELYNKGIRYKDLKYAENK